MHAWLCTTLDGAEALTWQELPTPAPGPGQVRIAIHAASLNFPDLLTVQGKYQVKPPLPFVPGSEFSGLVEAVGDGVTQLQPGMPVAAIGSHGGFATHAVAGFAGGGVPALPWNLALLKGASVVGVFWGDFVRREPQASAAALAQLARWYAQGKIEPVIDGTLPMSELKAAYARMGTRQVMGKLLLVNP